MSWRFWQPPLSREVDEELAFHLEMRVRELMAAEFDDIIETPTPPSTTPAAWPRSPPS